MYKITDYTRQKAKELNVDIYPSSKGTKKLDIYRDGKFVASIGDIRYGDFPTFKKVYGEEYANIRRIAYYNRHKKDIKKPRGFLTAYLLW